MTFVQLNLIDWNVLQCLELRTFYQIGRKRIKVSKGKTTITPLEGRLRCFRKLKRFKNQCNLLFPEKKLKVPKHRCLIKLSIT